MLSRLFLSAALSTILFGSAIAQDDQSEFENGIRVALGIEALSPCGVGSALLNGVYTAEPFQQLEQDLQADAFRAIVYCTNFVDSTAIEPMFDAYRDAVIGTDRAGEWLGGRIHLAVETSRYDEFFLELEETLSIPDHGLVQSDLNYVLNIINTSERDETADRHRLSILDIIHHAESPLLRPFESSWFTAEYIETLAEHGRTDEIANWIPEIGDPNDVLALRLQRQFDTIDLGQNWESADVIRNNFDAHLQHQITLMEAFPERLYVVLETALVYASLGQFQDATDLLQEALRTIEQNPDAFVDLENTVELVHFALADFLSYQGRNDSAKEFLRQTLAEATSDLDTDFYLVQLAQLELWTGNPDRALELFPEDLNLLPVGWARVHAISGCAYAALGDSEFVDLYTEYFEETWEISPRHVQEFYTCTDDEEASATTMIRRLRDPEHRTGALWEVQHYLLEPEASTDLLRGWDARFEAMVARPDVQDAINEVGRVLTLPLAN